MCFEFSLPCYLVVKDVVRPEVTLAAEDVTGGVWLAALLYSDVDTHIQ